MKHFSKILSLLVVMTLVVTLLSSCGEAKKAAKEAYANEVSRIQTEQADLDKAITNAQSLVDSKEKPFDETLIPAVQTEITNAKAMIVEIPEAKGKAEEIEAIVNNLKQVSYVEETNMLRDLNAKLSDSIKIMKQVTNPSEEFIVSVLQRIPGVTGYAACTEDHDPNGQLHKPGGYTSCIYGAYDQVHSDWLGNDIVENGTKGGLAIEVYETEEAAKNRDNYLAAFDGGILASGSHKVVGTVLVRTSDELNASQQQELENAIVTQLTTLQ